MVRLDYDSNGLFVRSSNEDHPHVLRGADTRDIADVLRIRMQTPDLSSPIWTNDTLTSAYVLYAPGQKPLFLRGFTIPDRAIVGEFPREGELRVEPEAINELHRYTSFFPDRSISIPTNYLGDQSQTLAINHGILGDYGMCLDQVAGIKFVQLVPLKKDKVNSGHGTMPFIRQVRVKGIREGNYNRGGFLADVPIRATEKEHFLMRLAC